MISFFVVCLLAFYLIVYPRKSLMGLWSDLPTCIWTIHRIFIHLESSLESSLGSYTYTPPCKTTMISVIQRVSVPSSQFYTLIRSIYIYEFATSSYMQQFVNTSAESQQVFPWQYLTQMVTGQSYSQVNNLTHYIPRDRGPYLNRLDKMDRPVKAPLPCICVICHDANTDDMGVVPWQDLGIPPASHISICGHDLPGP